MSLSQLLLRLLLLLVVVVLILSLSLVPTEALTSTTTTTNSYIHHLPTLSTSITYGTGIGADTRTRLRRRERRGRTRDVSCNSSNADNSDDRNNNNNNNNNSNNNPIADIGSNLREKFRFNSIGQENEGYAADSNSNSNFNSFTAQQQKTKQVLSSLGITMKEPEVGSVDTDRSSYLDVGTASIPFVLRLGSGAFVEGYKVGFKPKNNNADNEYIPYNVQFQVPITNKEYQLYETSTYTTGSNDEIVVRQRERQPRGPIILYEFEACPFCRKVREAVCMLELTVEFRPCPKDSNTCKSSFRQDMKDKFAANVNAGKGNKITYPFMIDPNTGIEMFESDDIISYLFRSYGRTENGDVPSSLSPNFSTTFMTGISLLLRWNKGLYVKDSKYIKPISSSTTTTITKSRNGKKEIIMKPLILWSSEGTPFGKLVREKLNELQICHVQIPCPRGSDNRQRLYEKTNCTTFQIPYLEDPNSGVGMFESAMIVEYLDKMYGVQLAKVEYM